MRVSHDYRIFVGAFPEGEPAERIQTVRRQYDLVTAGITPPHVTIAGTYWRSGPAIAANEAAIIARLSEATLKIPPFDLVLGGIKTFPQKDKPVIYLGVELTFSLLSARMALVEAIGADKHAGRYTPHLTLAMRLNNAHAQAMLVELQSHLLAVETFTAPVHRLRLMQRGSADPVWRCIKEFSLQDKD